MTIKSYNRPYPTGYFVCLPGEIIEEYLSHKNWSVDDLANKIQLPLETVKHICEGKIKITESIASSLSGVLDDLQVFG